MAESSVATKPKTLKFSVDSALLRELGERLVGKAHVALAELVKNSYDADATEVVIHFDRNRITVSDNGHGMTLDEFTRFWMRIGSTHKQKSIESRGFHRPLTGSKGVGRLSVQFLAAKMSLVTVSNKDTRTQLSVEVNWRDAQTAGELTEAEATYIERPRQVVFPKDFKHGTRIELSELNETWDARKLTLLAREIWALQPPFAEALAPDDPHRFQINLESADKQLIDPAQAQLRAHLDIWEARLVGKLPAVKKTGSSKRPAHLVLEFAGGNTIRQSYSIIHGNYGSTQRKLDAAEFEVRIFKLAGKQRFGVGVSDARDYLNKFGGVHIYDAGFHLPYYGAETDWLRIEIEHSHRRSKSQLLPEQFHVPSGMNNLPTNSRIFGVVRVNTSQERAHAEKGSLERPSTECLMISVTRDRLVENMAYANLRTFVRWALDFYAMEETKRKYVEQEAERPIEPSYQKLVRIDRVIDEYAEELPERLVRDLKAEIREAEKAAQFERNEQERQAGLLGALASAGIATLAFEHEFQKQVAELDGIIDSLNEIAENRAPSGQQIRTLAARLRYWHDRAKGTRQLFLPLLEEDSRTKRLRLKARPAIGEVVARTEVLLRGIAVDISKIDDEVRLPPGTLAEWAAIFQNILVNAVNAMLDSRTKRISIRSESRAANRAILVEDTGRGVNLKTAGDLFKPFVRRGKISLERQQLGLGGTGLGLTIVKMIADSINCGVEFVEPDSGYKTAFKISWRESG